ncbi:MAG: hypothetical protein RL500_2365 [Pseudomonadota bacterium]|jgi:hypothetical protein|nr:CcoQ/FixQ family Cbb3-type cytochrome c oxidase assembly chaperone [Betaproteobacteria bacterium]
MDINDLRSLITMLGFGLFVGLVANVWRRRAAPSHEAASRLVFEGEAPGQALPSEEVGHG